MLANKKLQRLTSPTKADIVNLLSFSTGIEPRGLAGHAKLPNVVFELEATVASVKR